MCCGGGKGGSGLWERWLQCGCAHPDKGLSSRALKEVQEQAAGRWSPEGSGPRGALCPECSRSMGAGEMRSESSRAPVRGLEDPAEAGSHSAGPKGGSRELGCLFSPSAGRFN